MACLQPFNVKGYNIPVPCGKCANCLKRRISGWSFRLTQQDKIASSSNFITLTYDSSHVPITRNGYMCLNRRHVQLFLKRLRKAEETKAKTVGCETERIKYFAVGEYGGKTLRPHYHIILFNCDITLIQDSWGTFTRSTQYVWKRPRIVEHKQHIGSVHYGTVSGASVGYCLKYMMKRSRIPMHKNDDRIPEFALMSKGLGLNYVSDNIKEWHHADLENRMYLNIEKKK